MQDHSEPRLGELREPSPHIVNGLRQLLNNDLGISSEQLALIMRKAGCELHRGLSKSSLSTFLRECRSEGKKVNFCISYENERVFERFLFETPIGQALLNPAASWPGRGVEMSPVSTGDEGKQYAGLWLGLHGSYLYEKHMAIHRIEIKLSEDGSIYVIGDIKDSKKNDVRRSSKGNLTLTQSMPQIRRFGNENRSGHSLFSGSKVEFNPDFGLLWIFGVLSGLSERRLPFSRRMLMIKWADAVEGDKPSSNYDSLGQQLYEVTGIRGPSAIRGLDTSGPLQKAIKQGFDALAHWTPTVEFSDPISDWVKSKRNQPSVEPTRP